MADDAMLIGVDAAPVRTAVSEALDVGQRPFAKLDRVSLDVEDGKNAAHRTFLQTIIHRCTRIPAASSREDTAWIFIFMQNYPFKAGLPFTFSRA
jgi:hypothetical protein